MFERLIERAQRAAQRRATDAAAELHGRIEAELPPGIKAEASAEGARLLGRGLRRRFALDPALRWFGVRLK